MSAFALISGALFRAPERKTSKSGKSYASATLKVSAGNDIEFWRLLVFSESAQTELMRLGDGDKLAAQGSLRVEFYRGNDGAEKISRTLLTDAVLALSPQPKAKSKQAAERKPRREPSSSDAGRVFNDAVPF